MKNRTNVRWLTQLALLVAILLVLNYTPLGYLQMGLCTALIFNALRKAMPKNEKLACFLGGLSAPVLNTVFFMGFLVLIFYNCDYVQNLANTLGAQNAFMFIVLLVGVQAIFEWVLCCVVAGAVSLPVRNYLQMN